MKWVKARAYRDGNFLLERLFSQVASDVHEVNKLPASLRHNCRLKILREATARGRFSVFWVAEQGLSDPSDQMLFIAQPDYVAVVQGRGQSKLRVSGSWDEDTKAEQWFDVDQGDQTTYSTEGISRHLLESFFFDKVPATFV